MSANEPLKRAIAARANAWEHAKTILDEAEGRAVDGVMSAEDEARWANANESISAYDKRIGELSAIAEREAEARSILDEMGDIPAPKAEARTEQPSDDDILRSIAKGERRQAEFRDLSKLTAAAGGNTVPTSFYGQLKEHMIEVSGIRQTRATVLSTSSGEALQVPKTTSHSTAAIITEGSAISESDPAFGQVTLDSFKYALIVQVSRELSEDTGVNLSEYLARQAGRAIGNASGAHFVTGDGSAKPNGAVTASTLGVTGASGVAGVFDADELIDLYYSVIAPYRVNAEWLMGDGAESTARKLKGSDNNYLWQPGLMAGTPNMLLGKPIVNDPNVADPALSAKSVLFGDFSAYFIRDVNSIAVDRSTEFAFNTDLISWRFLFRTDGDLVDTTGAIKHFIGNAA